MKRTYLVVFEKGKRNFSGFAPDVPGCGSAGTTLDEMRVNMKEALDLYMEVVAEQGDPFPEAVTGSISLPIEGELDLKTSYVVERISILLPKKVRSQRTRHSVQRLTAA